MKWLSLLCGALLAGLASVAEGQVGLAPWQAHFLASVAAPPASAVVVQKASGGLSASNTSSTTGTSVFGSNVGSGSCLIVGFTFRDAQTSSFTGYTPSISDTRSNTWTQQTLAFDFVGGGTNREFGAYIYSTTSGSAGADTVSITVSGGSSMKGGAVWSYEVTGTSCTASANGNSIGNGNAGAMQTNSSIAFSASPFLLSVQNRNVASGGTVTSSGFTTDQQNATNTEFDALYAVSGVTSPTSFLSNCSGCGAGVYGILLAAIF